jgi:hypothetical protein
MMSDAIFLRLLFHQDKTLAMDNAIEAINKGDNPNNTTYAINPTVFSQIPGSAFAYWTNRRVRLKFSELPRFESLGREVRIGDHPSDDFKYLRLSWEISLDNNEYSWIPYQKGGDYSPYYYDIHLLVNWDISRQTYRGFYGRPGRKNERPSNYQYFFRPGLTWPRRTTRGLSIRALPAGCVFADKGPSIFSSTNSLLSLLGLVNSVVFKGLVALQMAAGSYEVGVIQRTPLPDLSSKDEAKLDGLALLCINIKQDLDCLCETSHIFHLPALLNNYGETLGDRLTKWRENASKIEQQFAKYQSEIDEIAFNLYNITNEDRQILEESLKVANLDIIDVEDSEVDFNKKDENSTIDANRDTNGFVAALFSYALGCSFGRWDIRFATGERIKPKLPDPFAPLPVCSPGMLTGDDGRPLNQTPLHYPLAINWNGILVDDPDHPDDIVKHVQDALAAICQEKAEAIEQEACQILFLRDLREYFRKPSKGGFWADHIQRYSKSRRKAPIYWLLQSSKKNYGIWLYYHHLTKDTLFKALSNYVEPKIRQEVTRLEQLCAQKALGGLAGREVKRVERQLERQEGFHSELTDFRDKLRRAANLYLEPDLNDGVVLNIAPLWELVPWNDAKKYWEELLEGKYEWSSISQQLREKGHR